MATIPEQMTAALVPEYGETDPKVEWTTTHAVPKRIPGKKQLLIRVLACSTAFGDIHILSGRVSLVFKPPCLPYIPGKDLCGIVMECDADSSFHVGDCVVTSKDAEAYGGMAEFVVVLEKRTCLKPESLNPLEAACYPDSPVTALNALLVSKLVAGERVLVLGGSGGVGSCLLQLVKNVAQPSLLASTSTQTDLVASLGVDRPIDYRSENWWEIDDFQKQPLDCIIDCVGGNDNYEKSRSVLKPRSSGGRFVAVAGSEPRPLVQNVFQLFSFAGGMLRNPIVSTFRSSIPNYLMVASETKAEILKQVLEYVEQKKLAIVLDPKSPFPFTADGVKSALSLQASGHAHGKVVVELSKR